MAKTGKIRIEMTSSEQQLFREMKRLEAQYGSLKNAMREVGRESEKGGEKGKKAGRETGSAANYAAGQVKNLVLGFVGAAGLVSAVKQVIGAYDVWKNKMYEVGTATKAAMDSMIAFLALQEPGKKRERLIETLDIAARFGIKEMGVATDIAQAMQSVPGRSWEQAKQAMRGIFGAKQVGIPIEAGREAEVIASTQGMAPGEALWRSYVVGQASQRTPADVIKAAGALAEWQKPETAFAAAGILTGTRGQRVEVYLRQLGVALSKTSALAEKFSELGVLEGATQRQRLEALHKAGFRTPEQLAEAGLGEIRQRGALSDVLRNMEAFNKGLRVQQQAQADGVAIFLRQRKQIERELPAVQAAREAGIAEARFGQAKVSGPQALRGEQMVTEARALSTVLTRRGIYTAFGTELAKESGEAVAKTWPLIMARYPMQYGAIKTEYQAELDAIRLRDADELRQRNVQRLRLRGAGGLAEQLRDLARGPEATLGWAEETIAAREGRPRSYADRPPHRTAMQFSMQLPGMDERPLWTRDDPSPESAVGQFVLITTTLKQIRDIAQQQLDESKRKGGRTMKPADRDQ